MAEHLEISPHVAGVGGVVSRRPGRPAPGGGAAVLHDPGPDALPVAGRRVLLACDNITSVKRSPCRTASTCGVRRAVRPLTRSHCGPDPKDFIKRCNRLRLRLPLLWIQLLQVLVLFLIDTPARADDLYTGDSATDGPAAART